MDDQQMLAQWKNKLDILGPIDRAARCLDIWLGEENLCLTERRRQLASALIARYFLYEDEVNDELMLSFLRHYSSGPEVDMDDPTSVRMEIKSVLDKAYVHERSGYGRKRLMAAFIAGMMIMTVGTTSWELSHRKINKEQQAELKAIVHRIAELDHDTSHAAIWAGMKAPLQVRSYQNISWWQYKQSLEMLKKRLDDSLQKQSGIVGAGM